MRFEFSLDGYTGLGGLDGQTGSFTLKQIKAATDNFNPANKIGEGGFGVVFKVRVLILQPQFKFLVLKNHLPKQFSVLKCVLQGVLTDGTVIAVKQLSAKSTQGNREFLNEIGMISCLQHPNLVKLHGCCIEGDQLLLVYEYLEHNSLSRALFGKPNISAFKPTHQFPQSLTCLNICRS